MADVRAADLPEGSIVEYLHIQVQRDATRWISRRGVIYSAAEVEHALANGGKVLRDGYGEDV